MSALPPRRTIADSGGGLLPVLMGILLSACGSDSPEIAADDENLRQASAALESKIRQQCSACHLYPEPEILPAWAWEKVIKRMYALALSLIHISEPTRPTT